MSDIRERRCATESPGTGDQLRMRELEADFRPQFKGQSFDQGDVNVPLHFIHITDGQTGIVSQSVRDAQMRVLNDSFAATGISFFEEANKHINNADYFYMGHRSRAERVCKTENNSIDPYRGINIYTGGLAAGLLGWATFPHWLEEDPIMDGVVVAYDTLPGGGRTHVDEGKTLVHEIGHLVGLYHTFENGCTAPGDDIGDTPSHSGPNYGKPDPNQRHNLCPSEPASAKCPVKNFMNYVDDKHMDHFTPGQIERIWSQLTMFRPEWLNTSVRLLKANERRPQRVQW